MADADAELGKLGEERVKGDRRKCCSKPDCTCTISQARGTRVSAWTHDRVRKFGQAEFWEGHDAR